MNESMYEHFARMYGPDRVRWDDAGRLHVDVPGEGDMTFTFPRPRVVPAEETYLMVRRQFGFPMSLEEMDTVRAEFESQLAYQSRIMREDRMMRF